MLPAVCARLLPACAAAVLGLTTAHPALARTADPPGSLYEIPLPGGLAAAMTIVDDRAAPDRGQFLLDVIRRFYDTPFAPKGDRREPVVRALVSRLELAAGQPADAAETLPLPLHPSIWNDVVFGGQPPSAGLLASIVQSRAAALFYYGLMSLDEQTRSWLATDRTLLRDVSSRHAAAFAAAAPGLRVGDGRMRLPGGDAAAGTWEALVGRRVNEPAAFVRALLSDSEGRMAVFFGAVAVLTPAQIGAALQLDSPQPDVRNGAARRLFSMFERVVPAWRVEERAFWRPVIEPMLLIAELPAGADGAPVSVGTRSFWASVFEEADSNRPLSRAEEDTRALANGDTIGLLELCDQVLVGDPTELRRRYQLALFGSRLLLMNRLTPETARDSVDAIRASAAFSALTAALERAGLTDVATYAAAARRAVRLSAIDDQRRALRALGQFQGALAILARAAVRGGLTRERLQNLVASLSAIDQSEAGEYEGRLVRWVTSQLAAAPAPESDAPMSEAVARTGAVEQALIRLLSGSTAVAPQFVEWEGTRYRLDASWAEATRIARLLGDDPVPHISAADRMVRLADALAQAGIARDELQRQADALQQLGDSLGWGDDARPDSDVVERYHDSATALRRAAREGDVRAAARISPSLRILADDLLAHGLAELVYATALGEPGRTLISAGEAARRHDYGLDSGGLRRASAPWRLPVAGASIRGWRVTGALLGLDVRLAEFALRQVTSRPPPRKPMLNDEDRRVMTEAAVLARPGLLRATEHEAIVAALAKGRARVAAARTPADALALAEEIRLGAARRTLLSWAMTHDPARVPAFLSPAELFWLGLDAKPVDAAFHAWGALAEPRAGCLCLRMPDRRPWETLAGRWNSGILASGFVDLNLRLAELLAELRMPAPLLAGVLPAATLELINHAVSRDQDDRRGPVEFVQSLRVERLEQYLALLTTDGPLVPVDEVKSSSSGARLGSAQVQTTRESR